MRGSLGLGLTLLCLLALLSPAWTVASSPEDDWAPGYELVAKPIFPINISEIDADVRDIVSRTRVAFCFDEACEQQRSFSVLLAGCS